MALASIFILSDINSASLIVDLFLIYRMREKGFLLDAGRELDLQQDFQKLSRVVS